jgi:serine/threonine protein phosphatase 1
LGKLDIISYIIGDIHGQADLLERLLANIESRHNWKYSGKKAKLVYLGDYIDRGPNSAGVIDLVMKGLPDFSNVFLKGNHEQMLIDALTSDDRSIWNNWMSAGGEITLKSLNYDIFQNKYDIEKLHDCLGEVRIKWLKSLELTHKLDDIICVHAGFCPNTSLDNQLEKDMLWIRKRFLGSGHDFGFGIVHGHTPDKAPIVKSNRIEIDTGAGMGGELTALVVNKPWGELILQPDFISVC